jgi:putative ABC transport system substrate-binding protein
MRGRRTGLIRLVHGFLTGFAFACLVAAFAASAQPAVSQPVIGYLGNGDPQSAARSVEAFEQGLRDRGWINGKTVRIEYRWAEGNVERLPELIADLLRLKADILFVSGPPAISAARKATSTVPIVMGAILVDPVQAGFVHSLARPGGNITGMASQYEDILTKQVELLTETVPKLSRLFVLRHTSSPIVTANASVAAAQKLGLTVTVRSVSDVSEYEAAFRTARSQRAQAIHVLPNPSLATHRGRLIDLAARYQLPAIYEHSEFVREGGLISYGVSIPEMHRSATSHIDRILRGAKAGDLPIERPSKFELALNVGTAKILGVTISPSLLLRADQVIE